MTSEEYNLGSKRPHLHRAYVLGEFTNISTTVLAGIIVSQKNLPVQKPWPTMIPFSTNTFSIDIQVCFPRFLIITERENYITPHMFVDLFLKRNLSFGVWIRTRLNLVVG